MNTARKLVHEDVYKHLDQLEMKQTALLSDLILSSDESALLLIGYWEGKKLAADAGSIAIYNNQIDLLERRMMAKTILIEDLLNCVEITGGIPTMMGPTPLIDENISVEELGEEKATLDISTGKPVAEKAKAVMAEVEKTLEKETKIKEVEVPENTTDAVVVTERKNLDDIKALIIPIIQAGNEESARALYSAYMEKGMWLNKKNKAGNAMNKKEFATNWADLLKKAAPTSPIALATQTETTIEAETTPKSEVEAEVVNTEPVAVDELVLDDEKATLTTAEENLKSYQKFYPADSNAEQNISSFTKTILNVTEEEEILSKIYAKVINLFDEKKHSDASELSRLFFSERAYSDAQIGKWMVAAARKEEITNHLKFLADAVTLRASDSVNEMIQMAITAVREDKTAKETVWDWVKRNV